METFTTNSKIMASEQSKASANAFKLLMDSRNKTIGSNSPGKEKTDDSQESAEVKAKKDAKAKHLLVLQTMADAKGSSKNKEIEKLQEDCIKIKMDKRAERLKAMIAGSASTKPSKIKQNKTKETKPESVLPKDKKDLSLNKKHNVMKSLNLIDMFIENDDLEKKFVGKPLLKDDEEFLNKLSPSLRKKENMMCYFKKIEKDKEYLDDADSEVKDSLIIKVKLKPRTKSKKKLSLKKKQIDLASEKSTVTTIDISEDISTTINPHNAENGDKLVESMTNNNSQEKSEKLQRRKRKHTTSSNIKSGEIQVARDNERPKRNAKKPLKYVDDVFLTSSDEELQLTTPKKQKHIDKVTKFQNKCPESIDITTVNNFEAVATRKIKKVLIEKPKPQTKLAPIFNPKAQIPPEASEAKLKFLQSGVPEKLKKKIEQNKSIDTHNNYFPTVTHVQQIEEHITANELTSYKYNESCNDLNIPESPIHSFLSINIKDTSLKPTPMVGNITTILQSMKASYPKFPVYRTYHTLKSKSKGEIKDCNIPDLDNSVEILNNLPDIKNESPDKLTWCDKYRPASSKQIIGNFETVRELKRWLETWTEYDDKKISSKNNSDSSDFIASDTDSRDSIRSSKNLLIITGPVGSGKTSAVYAVAAELAIKVIEVNASSRRTGKIMLQDLQEATQSHKVNRAKGSQETQKSQDKPIECIPVLPKKRGRKKKVLENSNKKQVLSQDQVLSQESVSRTCMSLILIDDADVVFEQDDGFCSAISQLVYCSKRPVILITGSLLCPHLQRFIRSGRILKTNPFIPRMLGTWLDIMCLADTSRCWPGMGNILLDHFKGDIRKTINYLQFYMSTEANSDSKDSQNSDSYKPHLEDENSNMSWIDVDQDLLPTKETGICLPRLEQLQDPTFSPTIFDYWWNIPNVIHTETDKPCHSTSSNLAAIANALDTFSSIDYCNIHSYKDITSNPWFAAESDSVVEIDNSDIYNSKIDVNKDICQFAAENSLLELHTMIGNGSQIEIKSPVMAEQRRKDKLVARHSALTTFLNPSNALDRRSLALDYWSACRTICRIEKLKADSNARRNNRFCHYLKTSNVLCRSESFDHLCNSLKSFHNS